MATLIRVDRNGTKYYEGEVSCPRCDGKGIYYIGVLNGKLLPSHVDYGVCFRCGGSGTVHGKWKEYTPEYEEKLNARRRAKWEAEEAERKAEEERQRAEKEAEEKRLAELEAQRQADIARSKAISQYVGQIGDKFNEKVTYAGSAYFTVRNFYGYGTDTMYIHKFRDAHSNLLVWKTSTNNMGHFDEKDQWIPIEEGTEITLKGTIKEHSEYKDEKQTFLTRCRIEK